ncbi:hypothetical protein GW755_03860 [bacterium]|nr:hypothetical protein [bacterium]
MPKRKKVVLPPHKNLLLVIQQVFDRHPKVKFISVVVLLFSYFLFVSFAHGIKQGLLISVLTWSFFVLCTPVAEAGILIDFPMRLITKIRMVYSEIMVWLVAIIINIVVFITNPKIYEQTLLLSLFKHVLDAPYPYWIIIFFSAVGTFLSIYIADSIMDSKKHKNIHPSFLFKHKTVVFIFLIILVVVFYDFLLNKMGVSIPLI